jgi:multidrug efflux pump
MLIGFIATIPLNVVLVVVIPKGFFPQQDTGQLQGGIRGDATLVPADEGKLQAVAKIIQQDPAVTTVTGSVGAGGFGPFGGGGPSANVTVALKPL